MPDAALRYTAQARAAYRLLGNHSMAIIASRIRIRYIHVAYQLDQPTARGTIRADLAHMADDLERASSGGIVPPDIAGLMARLLDSDLAVVKRRWTDTRTAALALFESGQGGVFLRQVIGSLGANGNYDAMYAVVLSVAFLGFAADRLYLLFTRWTFAWRM